MDTDSDSEVPSKRPRSIGPKTIMCVLCNVKGPCNEMTKPKDKDSWQNLLMAAEIQNFDELLQYRDSQEIPEISYHGSCRKSFTHKKTLERIQKEEAGPSCASDNVDRELYKLSRRDQGISSSRVYDKVGIFCDKVSKYKKGTNSREQLCKSVDLRSDMTVRQIAEKKMDQKILAITSRELVAAEAHYHKSCYKIYTKVEQSVQSECEIEKQDVYSSKEIEAYIMLFEYIRSDLFESPRVIPMTKLSEALVINMNSLGVTDIKPQTKKHIRRKLESELGDSIEIVTANNGRLYVIPSNLTRAMLVHENIRITSELESLRSESPRVTLKKCALDIRNEIKNRSIEQEWPPQPEHLNNKYLPLPASLTNFFETMLAGDLEKKQPSEKVDRLVNSFAQDCVYAISGGKQKPSKHILLPWAVKSLTGNVELIKVLNRLGHGISYSLLEEIDTALCLQKLEDTDDIDIALPSNILPCIPTTLAFDNIDRLEETLSGSGTSHRVNGIVIQPQVPTVPEFKEHLSVDKLKRRSINPPASTLAPYIAGKRIGPAPIVQQVDLNNNNDVQNAHLKNIVWSLVRQNDTDSQKISSWTGFNIQTRDNVYVIQDKVGYLPTINAPATDMSTVNEILHQCLKIIRKLDLTEIVCVFDQALYAKAAEVIWKNTETFRPIIIRMGAFHTLCNVMGTIGKRFKDAGLRDLAVESSVIAEGSIDGVLEGRKYNRAVRLHKLVYEAMMRLVWKGFYSWLEEEHQGEVQNLNDTIVVIENLHTNVNQDQLAEVLNNSSCKSVFQLFMTYQEYLRNDHGELSAFWMSYLDMVDLVLGLIRASREGDWHLHLAMIRAIIPWCFAYDKQNYARYLSVYYSDMTRLEAEHPNTYDHFLHGGFSVQCGEWNTFGRIPVDQTIEETANKDTQTAGGTKGFSLKPGAVSRYYLTAEHRSMCLRNLREMTEIRSSGISHTDLQPERTKTDEKAVQILQDMLENRWIDPYSETSQLVSISTATAAPQDVRNDILSAREKGEGAYNNFRQSRLEKEQPSESFYDRLPKLQLRTFSDIRKTKKTKVSGKEFILRADHKLFGHMVLVASSRNLDMRQVLQHPLGPLPWALADCDGTMRKTNKAALARTLEKRVSSADTIPRPSACIIDAMSLVNKVNGENRTFGDLSECIFVSALQASSNSTRLDIVFDVYRNISIKNAERIQRGSDAGIIFSNIVAGQRIQQWRRLLGSSDSKTALINFLVDTWKTPPYLEKLGDKQMYVTCQEKCYRITREGSWLVDELNTSQEEADTRMLLHAKHASEEYHSLVIVSEDTDVLILSLGLYRNIGGNIYIRCGTKNRLRNIDVSKVGDSIGQAACEALIGLHSFTGCDSVSAFGGRGKVAAMKLITKQDALQSAMAKLGEDWMVSPELFLSIQEFTCKMYAARSSQTTVNDLRYQLFRAKKGDVESGQLPDRRLSS